MTSIPTRNVILFGETNSGKTSIINMIARTSVAPISNDLRGTHDCTVYPIQLGELEYAVYDTPGIDATALGTDPVTKLVEDLQHGVCLLVFCMRGRVTEDAAAIYQHFRSLFKKVPVLAVITGLEHEDPMESWWTKNHSVFDKNDMSFIDHACVTTLRGKGSVFARQYEDSTKVVRNLIAACCLKEGQKAELRRRQLAITDHLPTQQRRQRRRLYIIIFTITVLVVIAVIIIAIVVSRQRSGN